MAKKKEKKKKKKKRKQKSQTNNKNKSVSLHPPKFPLKDKNFSPPFCMFRIPPKNRLTSLQITFLIYAHIYTHFCTHTHRYSLFFSKCPPLFLKYTNPLLSPMQFIEKQTRQPQDMAKITLEFFLWGLISVSIYKFFLLMICKVGKKK